MIYSQIEENSRYLLRSHRFSNAQLNLPGILSLHLKAFSFKISKRGRRKKDRLTCAHARTHLQDWKPNLFALYALELSFDLMRNQRICEMDELNAKLLSNAKSPHSQSWCRQGILRWNEIIVGEEISRFQMQSLPELIIHYNYWWFFHSRWICAWSCPVLYPTTACSRAWSKVRPFAPPAINLGPTVVNAHSFDAPL